MIPRILSLTLAASAALGAAEAQAQALYNQPGRSPLGGGLIEMLMTGREPGQAYGPMRGGAPVSALPEDPFAEPMPGPQRRRMAALPSGPAIAAIAREPAPEYRRQVVAYEGREAPGTIVVDTPSRLLYLVQPGGQAIRYGIGVGRPGFEWAGMKTVSAKKEWPSWTPPAQMLKRRPDLPRHMAGGPENPLGARALYLGSSLYRIHGTNEPHTIGQNVSSGCIRMMNEDVTDLYERVPVGARVKVI